MLTFISNIYTSYISVSVILITAIGLFFLIKKPLYTFYIIVFTLPFKSLYIWIGTNIEAWKILSGVSLLLYSSALLIGGYNKIKTNKYFNQLIFYCGYTIFLTIFFIFIIPSSEQYSVEGGFFKNEGRFILQIFLFLITINLILLPIFVIKKPDEIIKILKVHLYAIIALSILGIIQETVIRIFGIDLFPIHRPGGIFDYEGGYYHALGAVAPARRMSSLAGEPKHLAIALDIGILITLLYRVNGVKIIKNDIWVIVMFLLCLLVTHSGTGYVWFGIITIIVMLLYRFKLPKAVFTLIIVSGLSMFIFNIFSSSKISPYLMKTYNRLGIEVQDQAVLDFFKKNPLYAITGLGLGNIHFYAEKYLPPEFPIFRDTPFKGNTGFFLLLGDVGLLGILIFTLFSIGLIKTNKRLIKTKFKNEPGYKIINHLMIVAFILFWFRYYEFFFVILGLMLYLNNVSHNKIYSNK